MNTIPAFRQLEAKVRAADLHRPMRITRYDPGTELEYEVTSVGSAATGTVKLAVERFVGGGFAGQVYQVRVREIRAEGQALDGLEVDGLYAMKILIPPSGRSPASPRVRWRSRSTGAAALWDGASASPRNPAPMISRSSP